MQNIEQPKRSGLKTVETLPDGITVEKETIRVKNLNGTEIMLERTLKARGNEWLEETIRDAASGKILSYNDFELMGKIRDREALLEMVFGAPPREDQKSAAAFLPDKFVKKTIEKLNGN